MKAGKKAKLAAIHTTRGLKRALSGWGLISRVGLEVAPEDLAPASRDAQLSRGLGRSYGDAALPARENSLVLTTVHADRIISFDEETGLLTAEAGLSLLEMNRIFIPRGWFTPVTPGTQFVTLGGMIAADVHGKNHHAAGTIGRHVAAMTIRTADGKIRHCSAETEHDLFWATIGGMGLTGHILEAQLRLEKIPSPWIESETVRISGLDEFIAALESAGDKWPFTVGWIDCLKTGRTMGRGLLMCGRWAQPGTRPGTPTWKAGPSVPFRFPSWALNRFTIRAFNSLYFHKQLKRRTRKTVSPYSFFYPLDAINDWNKIYGAGGFTQFQCVIPKSCAKEATREILQEIVDQRCASFLAVIKDFGEQGQGTLSFPMPGITLALDIPIRKETPALIHALNRLVIRRGGRIYLAKDLFTTADQFRQMEPRLRKFEELRKKWDPARRVRSALSVRLFGDGQ